MLNNTKHKSQKTDLLENLGDHAVTRLEIAETVAANAPRFDQVKSAERSIRRARRYHQNTGSGLGGWRVAL
jgi:hypothetical protein